jgi:N-sulfoglucosamine sulfohydrolase
MQAGSGPSSGHAAGRNSERSLEDLPVTERPNIVLLISHDTGRFISPYGIETVHTPNFEQLAEESVLFESAFCAAPQCSPSRAALVTGRHPHANGVMGLTHDDYAWGLHSTEEPVARLLGAEGYETWMLGLPHETRDAQVLGFDSVEWGLLLADLVDRLPGLLVGREPSRPFYCQMACFETHREWTIAGTRPDESLGIHIPPFLRDGPETRKEMAALQGMVRQLDRGLGRLLDLLEEHDLQQNTILIVTTDHGMAMPMAKGTLRDPGIETFLLMRYPGGGWCHGSRIQDLVSNVDVLPTLLEAVHLPIPDNVQGRSFLSLLQGKPHRGRDAVFAEKTFHDCYDPMRCIRTGRYKYIRYFEKSAVHRVPADALNGGASRELGHVQRKGVEELFDLEADPHEQQDLSGDAAHAVVCQEMRARLAAWMKETGDPLLEGPVASPFYYRSIEGLVHAEA